VTDGPGNLGQDPGGPEGPPAGTPPDQAGFDRLRPAPDHPVARAEAEREAAAAGTPDGDEGSSMGLLEHLEELRSVIMQSGIAAVAAMILCWVWSEKLLAFMIHRIAKEGIYFTQPNEAFMVRLKISAVCGVMVMAPFIFFKIYGFVLPGLYRRERKVVTPLLISTTALFYTGVVFAFVAVIPPVYAFLLSFGGDAVQPLIGVGAYFSFVSQMCLAFGLVFELPLLVLALSATGIVQPRMLLRTWRFAVVGIFILSAVLTPPDVYSQVVMAVPVLILYFGSVLVSLLVTRRRRKQD